MLITSLKYDYKELKIKGFQKIKSLFELLIVSWSKIISNYTIL